MKEEKKNNEQRTATLTLTDTVNSILLGELKSIIYTHKGSAYIKFLNIAICIEYLGACLDHHPFDKEGESETRFNDALKDLFDKKYNKYAKAGSDVYLYEDFRCRFVHQLRPSKKIVLTHREESKVEGTTHLKPIKDGRLVLVLEDLFDDFEKAAKKLIYKFRTRKITNNKGDKDFIEVVSIRDNG
jgi:hypothetical protein